MPYTPEFEKLLKDWSDTQVATYKHNLAGMGGNRWRQAQEQQAVIDTLQKNIPDVLDKLKQNNIGAEGLSAAKAAMMGDPLGHERLDEMVAGNKQLAAQDKQLAEFRSQFEQQAFGGKDLSLSQALVSTGGDIGNLNRFLGGQEAQTFNTQLKPLIQMALGSQGLSDSGAQVELQSKALAQLEQQRQQSMMQAALGARGQMQGLQRSDILGDIGFQQQQMNNQFDLSRSRITMDFQQQLENQREQLARELASRRGSNGLGGLLGGGLGMALGAGLGLMVPGGGAMGAMLGAGLGGSLGGGIGNYMSPNENYASMAQVPGSFFSAGSMMRPAGGSSNYDYSKYGMNRPQYGGNSAWGPYSYGRPF